MQQPQEPELAQRGVYWARYMKENCPIAYAVNSHGNVIRRYVIQHPGRAEMALATLWDYLDTADPPTPQLRLVKTLDLPTTERRAMVEVFDPYNLPPLPGLWRRA